MVPDQRITFQTIKINQGVVVVVEKVYYIYIRDSLLRNITSFKINIAKLQMPVAWNVDISQTDWMWIAVPANEHFRDIRPIIFYSKSLILFMRAADGTSSAGDSSIALMSPTSTWINIS